MTTIATADIRPTATPRGVRPLAGTGSLVRFILRRDRVRLPVWIVATVGLVLSSVASLPDFFPTAADRQARADLVDNPTFAALTGPGYGTDNYTFGAMVANEYISFTAVIVALMSIFLVVRHTRAEEQAGRTELLRSAVVGRYASTAAVLIVVGAANVLIGLLLALGLPATLTELSMSGSLLFGAGIASVGLVFTGGAALTAQLTEQSRAASGIAGAALAVAYTIRAIGDMGDRTASWLSPIGWAQAPRAYVDERWWPLLLSAGLTGALVAVTLRIAAGRDLGAGIVRPRPGPASASGGLSTPLGLAVRLQRGSLIGWGVGLFLLGLTYGSFVSEVEEFASDNEIFEDFLVNAGEASFVDSFAATITVFIALLAAGFAIQSTLRLRGEETAGRAEPVLAAAVSRRDWLTSHLGVALVGSAGMLLLTGLGLGTTAAATTGDGSWVGRMLGASLIHVPAVWLVIGVTVALIGLAPRVTILSWVVLAYGLVVFYLGGLLNFPDWLHNLSPFGHTPRVPAADFMLAPLLALTALAAALIATGLMAFARRDLRPEG